MGPPVLALLLLPSRAAHAQPVAATTSAPEPPVEVVVEGEPPQPGTRDLPLSRSIVDPELVSRPGGLAPTEALATVPGVMVQNRENLAQDVRLDVRGFGARSAFGMRGLRVVLDGLPVTLPDGQTALDSMALTDLGKLEVIRGPASVIYGAAPGGVILLFTEAPPDTPEAGARALAGAHGTLEARSHAAGRRSLPSAVQLGYRISTSSFASDGYRARARARTEALHLRLGVELRDGSNVALVTDLSHAPLLEDPGGLTEREFRADPRQAAPSSHAFAARESVKQLRSGVVGRGVISEHESLDAAVYLAAREFEGYRPQRVIELRRTQPGGYVRFTTLRPVGALGNKLSVGLDLDGQRDARRNLTNAAGVATGPALLDQGERVESIAGSAYELLSPAPWLTLLAGLRYQHDRYRLDDTLTADGDQSGTLSFTALSTLGGASVNFSNGSWFANAGRTHENPTLLELTGSPTGAGGLNAGLRPVSATSYETGVRWRPLPELRPELSVFRIDLRDELIPFEDETQRVYYRNAGRSHRDGVEASVGIAQGEMALRSSYTFLQAVFDEYARGGEDLSGNEVPGIPAHRLATAVRYGKGEGLRLGADLAWYDAVFVNDENDERSRGTLSTNLSGGYRVHRGYWQITIDGRVQNLLDRRQPDNVRVNAAARRYYEPAPGLSAFCGLEIVHAFARDAGRVLD